MRFKKIIISSLLLTVVISLTIFNAYKVNPEQLHIRKEVITSTKLDKSFNDFLMVFFSDLHYGEISDEYLDEVIEKINSLDPEVVLFGGDLVDHYSNKPLNDEEREQLINALAKIEAPLGKFAVLGNHDLDSENTKNAITNILEAADFNIITNKSVAIHNFQGASFNLIGLDSLALGNPDIKEAFSLIDESLYNLVLCHTPDIVDELPNSADYMLSGHSHGGQVYIPIVSSQFVPYGSQKHYHGKYQNANGTILDITNGIGTTAKKVRLNADSEIVAYKFKINNQ